MAETHGTPAEGATCLSCWDDIDASTYVEFKSSETSNWLPSGFCVNCVNHLLNSQWDMYTSALAKTTCKAEQRRLLKLGPPINIKDATALPCPDSGEAYSLWFMSDGEVHSAKLEGSLVGEERKKYWDDQLAFYIQDEPEEEKKDEEKKDEEKKDEEK